jgi:hypothetical protein
MPASQGDGIFAYSDRLNSIFSFDLGIASCDTTLILQVLVFCWLWYTVMVYSNNYLFDERYNTIFIAAASSEVLSASSEVLSASSEVLSASSEVLSASSEVLSASSEVLSASSEVLSASSEMLSASSEMLSASSEALLP